MREFISEILKNELFSIGKFHVYAYGLWIAIGILIGLSFLPYRMKKYNIKDDKIYNFILYLLIIGFGGAKLLSLLTTIPDIFSNGIIYWLTTSGFVVYGGIISGFIFSLFYFKKQKKDFLFYSDILIPLIPLVQGFGRLGCLFAGCCYGKVTDSNFSITYIESSSAPLNTPLFPSQFVSSILCFLLFFVLLIIEKKKKQVKGELLFDYLILYSIGRFMIEFFRGDSLRGFFLSLSTSQWISIIVFLVTLYFYKKYIKKENKTFIGGKK